MDPAAGPLIGGEIRDPPQQGGPRLRESVQQLSEAQSLAGPDHGRRGGPSSSSDSSALCVRRSSVPRWERMATTGAIRRRSTADRQDQHRRAHIRWVWPQASPAGRGSAPAAGNRHLEPARRPGDPRRSPEGLHQTQGGSQRRLDLIANGANHVPTEPTATPTEVPARTPLNPGRLAAEQFLAELVVGARVRPGLLEFGSDQARHIKVPSSVAGDTAPSPARPFNLGPHRIQGGGWRVGQPPRSLSGAEAIGRARSQNDHSGLAAIDSKAMA